MISTKTGNSQNLIKKLWTDDRLRFLVVGAFNTFFGYLLFSIFQYFFGHWITIFGSLYLSHIIGSTVAFYLYRKIVFPVSGNGLLDFLKFQAVYVVPLLTNSILLPGFVVFLKWNPYISQAVTTVLLTFISYFGHKFFSFRRPADVSKNEMKEHEQNQF